MSDTALRGVIPPLVTPLTQGMKLDEEGLPRLVEHVIGGGVHGLFLLGTTGEATNLPHDLRHEFVRKTCRLADGRVPILVGVTDTSFDESIKLSELAADVGACGIVAAAPYYFAPGQAELVEYYTRLAARSPLPLWLYNMPSHTKVNISTQSALELMRNPRIKGLKDSSGNITYFDVLLHSRCNVRPDFALLMGPEEALSQAILVGAEGGVCGGANLFPKLYVELYKAALDGDLPRVRELHGVVMEISTALYGVGRYMSSFIKGVKCTLELMGICSGMLSEPFDPFKAPERTIVAGRLARLLEHPELKCYRNQFD